MGLRIALTSVYAWPEVRRGAERYVHELAAALADAGHRVRILSTGAPRRDEVLGVPVRRLPARGRGGYGLRSEEGVFGGQALARLSLAGLDVWHATSTGDGAAACLLGRVRPRLRTVFTDHGFPVRDSRQRRGDAALHQLVADRVGSYVCVSDAAASWLIQDYGRRPHVIPPGVDTDRFRPGPGRAATPTVLYSGDLAETRKGVRNLVQAVGSLPGTRLQLVGPGTPDLSGLTTEHVDVLGLRGPQDLPALYRAAWVTALPATAEAFGMALTESLACGTPVVARRDGGGPAEIVTTGTGVLTEPGAAGLADGLRAALELSRQTDTAAACRARGEDFDWRRAIVPRFEELYAA